MENQVLLVPFKLNLSLLPKETSLCDLFYINNRGLVESKVASVFLEPNCYRRTMFRGLFLYLSQILECHVLKLGSSCIQPRALMEIQL